MRWNLLPPLLCFAPQGVTLRGGSHGQMFRFRKKTPLEHSQGGTHQSPSTVEPATCVSRLSPPPPRSMLSRVSRVLPTSEGRLEGGKPNSLPWLPSPNSPELIQRLILPPPRDFCPGQRGEAEAKYVACVCGGKRSRPTMPQHGLPWSPPMFQPLSLSFHYA